jgi:hypothetical protein
MEVHRSRGASCGGCHNEIDPVGLALEKYDKEGLWREVDINGNPISSDLMLFNKKVGEPMALAAAIEASGDYATCVATKALTYALNRGPTPNEACIAQELAKPRPDGTAPSLKNIVVSALINSLQLADFTP